MHEAPATANILEIAARHAAAQGADAVSEIVLVIGEASGYQPESFALYFDLLAEGTVCQGAALTVRTVPSKLRCPVCGALFARKPFSFACPECGADEGVPTGIGREFYVESITLAEGDKA